MRTRRRGSTLIEFALVAPVLLLLLAGVLNYTMALRTAMSASDAARAGAEFGSLSPTNSSDIAGMQSVAVNSAPTLTGLTAVASRSCRCSNGSAISCTATCSGNPPQVYVEVTTRATAPNWFAYPGLPYTGAVSGRAVMRAR